VRDADVAAPPQASADAVSRRLPILVAVSAEGAGGESRASDKAYTCHRVETTACAPHPVDHEGALQVFSTILPAPWRSAFTFMEQLMANDINATSATSDTVSTDQVVEVLNDLLENSRDGEYGFRACAKEVESAQLKGVFESRASQCASAASELAGLIRQLGGKPSDSGTVSGAMHRGWVHVKGTVGADSPLSMLEECERGEDAAVARYRKALKADLPAEVRVIVQRQADGAQRNHDQIKALRDQHRAAKA
jgi:uncharacterized protein (TIGR02284 family)